HIVTITSSVYGNLHWIIRVQFEIVDDLWLSSIFLENKKCFVTHIVKHNNSSIPELNALMGCCLSFYIL
ncbi:MAG TPA: hypothetical protein PKY85_09750, partial [Nitrosomonas sp.]|nr:hypothetical protein [Nitrosomonas sp.]